jgi:hypothetical protein
MPRYAARWSLLEPTKHSRVRCHIRVSFISTFPFHTAESLLARSSLTVDISQSASRGLRGAVDSPIWGFLTPFNNWWGLCSSCVFATTPQLFAFPRFAMTPLKRGGSIVVWSDEWIPHQLGEYDSILYPKGRFVGSCLPRGHTIVLGNVMSSDIGRCTVWGLQGRAGESGCDWGLTPHFMWYLFRPSGALLGPSTIPFQDQKSLTFHWQTLVCLDNNNNTSLLKESWRSYVERGYLQFLSLNSGAIEAT